MKWLLPALVVMMTLALGVGSAHAIPELQLYIEGAQYDTNTDTWFYSAGGNPILWVLGNVEATEGIFGVKLTAAVPTDETGSITLTPTTATGWTDPLAPVLPTLDGFYQDDTPMLGDGSALPGHGIFPGDFYQWSIGDFTLEDSPIGDFTQGLCPTGTCATPDMGQINAYIVEISGYSSVHFDSFDHIVSNNNAGYKYVFAPPSHDAEVPEPNTLLLVGSGLLGLGLMGRRFIGR